MSLFPLSAAAVQVCFAAGHCLLSSSRQTSEHIRDSIKHKEVIIWETPQEEQIDYANLLISCSESDIDFIPEEYDDIIPTIGGGRQRCMYILHVTVNGVEIPTEYVYFRAEGIPKADSFQLHINVDDSIRRKGIAFKLYQAFIRINGSACSLLKNRTRTHITSLIILNKSCYH